MTLALQIAAPDCLLLARLRNIHGSNRCLLSGVVQTRFAPSETFGPRPEGDLVVVTRPRGCCSARKSGGSRSVRPQLLLQKAVYVARDMVA